MFLIFYLLIRERPILVGKGILAFQQSTKNAGSTGRDERKNFKTGEAQRPTIRTRLYKGMRNDCHGGQSRKGFRDLLSEAERRIKERKINFGIAVKLNSCLNHKKIQQMKPSTENLVRIVLAVLLLICLLRLPYGYYQLIRFIAVIGFAILAYYESERKNTPLVIVFVGLAILFQPLAKIPLGRQVWTVVDLVVAAVLIVLVFVQKQKVK